ncbi:MAG TPA: prepilin-type N-terminal cleavage/methylation domain-containing protein [Candidatus Saccharimonadia bacterium]|nr:prepilin-type N-terminal cleavage/methylation domain-containing protein [Candidatus Saccharimonadia bacterium]
MLKGILKKEGGFTLLELLIVIVIIGILALLIIPNITSAPKKARDTQRKTDLRAIQKGLEEYFVSNNVYPNALTDLTGGNPPIMKAIPTDPNHNSTTPYTYTPANTNSTYTLNACLENANDTGTGVKAASNYGAGCSTADFQLVNNN